MCKSDESADAELQHCILSLYVLTCITTKVSFHKYFGLQEKKALDSAMLVIGNQKLVK